MKEYVIKGEQVSRIYEGEGVEVAALRNVSFSIRPGEFVVVLGPSGSGKSTLLNLMGGMDLPTDGKIWYRDQDLTVCTPDQLSDYRKDAVGFVFQFFNLIPSLTALENVELSASIVKNPRSSREMLKLVGLEGRETHFPSQLSGGEQQRVSIARAIVKNPKLLLCDEPTGALDSQNSREVVRLLLKVRDALKCPVVAITHNAGMAQVADRIIYMKDGKIERVAEQEHPVSVEEMIW